jgi:hypothetical protein
MSSIEWLRAHRELQYLRAAAHEGPHQPREEIQRRRDYANARWRKLQASKRKEH